MNDQVRAEELLESALVDVADLPLAAISDLPESVLGIALREMCGGEQGAAGVYSADFMQNIG